MHSAQHALTLDQEGHATLDKRYVALADTDLAARNRLASPADRLLGSGGRAS